MMTGGQPTLGFNATQWGMYGGTGTYYGTADLNANVHTATFDGASSVARTNGVVGQSGVNVGTATWTLIGLGSWNTSQFFVDGRVYGAVAIDRTLTAGEITDLETYLAAKSGVTL